MPYCGDWLDMTVRLMFQRQKDMPALYMTKSIEGIMQSLSSEVYSFLIT